MALGTNVLLVGLVLLLIYHNRRKDNLWGRFFRLGREIDRGQPSDSSHAMRYFLLGWMAIIGGLVVLIFGFRLTMVGGGRLNALAETIGSFYVSPHQPMLQDIRDKSSIRHDDVVGLNFIKTTSPYFFRRHFRQGLRSHIMEILKQADVVIENRGTVVDGVRWFPRAKPTRMLRIFRTRLASIENALAEIRRVKKVENYLGSDFIAASSEFLVDYHGPGGASIMLCGFQAYVEGEILDPWGLLEGERLLSSLYESLHRTTARADAHRNQWVNAARQKAAVFVRKIKRMIAEAGYIPDLAGAGNLVVPKTGEIRLVDINNISPVVFDGGIRLDDKGYPVCDKSVEALSLVEMKMLGRSIDLQDRIYQFFLDPDRKRQVQIKEGLFYRNEGGCAG